jgi:hypothetical protein
MQYKPGYYVINVENYAAAAPKAMLDAFGSEVKATAGEPFKIKIPYKGSKLENVTFYNVCTLANLYAKLRLIQIFYVMDESDTVRFINKKS